MNAFRNDLVDVLKRRQLASGGWSNNPTSTQASLEASCLATLAISSSPDLALTARQFLLRVQNSDGSWPAFEGDDRGGSWTTSLATIALRDFVPGIRAKLEGFRWLVQFAGKESNWFWKWKFRTTDRHVQFDPDKYGWPWFPDSLSWVVPTSFAIVALNQIPSSSSAFGQAVGRVKLGKKMLMDRACPVGGWNAGNGVVYGTPLAPHWDDTAVALLALLDAKSEIIVRKAAQWLERTVHSVSSPWSLAWAILALAAHSRSLESLLARLRSTPDLCRFEDTSTLAVVSLAFEHQNTLSALGVVGE
jgi:hypothetical protein